MADLRALYQELILDHGRRPRNAGPLPEANREAEGFNPLCGDEITLRLRVEGDRIADVRFEGHGCAISTASASLMTQALKGKTVTEAERLFESFHALFTGQAASGATPAVPLGKLAVLGGVREFPTRIKCATLAWHTLQAALHGSGKTGDTVSTEADAAS